MASSSPETQRLAGQVLARLQSGEHAVRLTEGTLSSQGESENQAANPDEGVLANPPGREEAPSRPLDTDPLATDPLAIDPLAMASKAVLSGSFAPLHEGHQRMRSVAQRWLGTPVHYELSVENADKPGCSVVELARRLAQFSPHDTVWVTRLPTFHEKALCLRPQWFVVGTDTMRRIADLRFYDHSEAQFDSAIRTWTSCGTKFLVFGRREGSRFCELDELELPAALRELCQGVAESRFRHDISSTQLRASGEW